MPAHEHLLVIEKDEVKAFIREQNKDVIKASRLSSMNLKTLELPICGVHYNFKEERRIKGCYKGFQTISDETSKPSSFQFIGCTIL